MYAPQLTLNVPLRIGTSLTSLLHSRPPRFNVANHSQIYTVFALSIESDFESQALKRKCISESKEISAQWVNYRFMSSLAAQDRLSFEWKRSGGVGE